MPEGYVYILLNTSNTAIVKIGKTHRNAETRTEEINRNPHLAGLYIVAYEAFVKDCDTVELKVHTKFGKKRVCYEYFQMPLKVAVAGLHAVIDDMKNQTELFISQQEPIMVDNWWRNTEVAWKQIFKSNIVIDYQNVTNTEIVFGIYSALQLSSDTLLRDKLCKFIKDRKRLKHNGLQAFNWYHKLPKSIKIEFNRYLPIELSDTQIEQVMRLKKIDCGGNQDITTLKPLTALTHLEELDCRDTQITNLDELKGLSFLRKINISYTPIKDLECLIDMPNLECIICNGFDETSVDFLKQYKPNCEIMWISESSKTLFPL